jgi:hypothetical protein
MAQFARNLGQTKALLPAVQSVRGGVSRVGRGGRGGIIVIVGAFGAFCRWRGARFRGAGLCFPRRHRGVHTK